MKGNPFNVRDTAWLVLGISVMMLLLPYSNAIIETKAMLIIAIIIGNKENW